MTVNIDAHAHLWDRRRFDYAWLDDEADLPSVFLPADLAAAGGSGIDAFVFVQADAAPDQGVAEATWVQSLAPTTPALAGLIAFAALEQNSVDAELDALAELDLVVGIRRLLQSEDVSFFEAPTFASGLRKVAARGWTFDACIRWTQMPELLSLARANPDLSIIVDHLAKPPVGEPDLFDDWQRRLSKLAELPNTSIKLSGLPAEASAFATPVDVEPWIRAGFDLFGPERSMIGTDWPVSAQDQSTRADWFATVRAAIGPADGEWAQIADGTARRIYGLPVRKISRSR